MEFLQGVVPREYQEAILEICKEKNCLVVLPTGLGKTLIALMLTIERMKSFPGQKVLFLAPTRPLAEQHLNYFKKNLSDLFGDMQLFTGSVNAKSRKKIWQTADIVFSTPQCIANDIKKGLYNLNEVCLLVEDEAHRCINNYDYRYVAQIYKEQAKNPRILGMTASPGSETKKIKEICNNLFIEAVELRTRESSDVKTYLKELKFEKAMVDLPEEFIKIRSTLSRLFEEYISELRSRKVFFGMPTKTELIKLQKNLFLRISQGNRNFNYMLASSACAQAIKVHHAIELLETQTQSGFNKYLKELVRRASVKESKGIVKLVSKSEFNHVLTKSNELLAVGIEHPKISKLIEIVASEKEKNENIKIIVFTQFRDTARTISKKINELSSLGLKSKVFVGQAKKTEVEIDKKTKLNEVSGLSQDEQKQIIREFSSGEVNVLCATSIGEEGLDIIEVGTVIFYEPVPSAIRTIQRTGRTARMHPGKLIILITRKTRDEAYFYISKAKEKKMHSAIDSIKEGFSKNSKSETQERLS